MIRVHSIELKCTSNAQDLKHLAYHIISGIKVDKERARMYRSFPFGLFLSAGYINMPPYSNVRCTSATMLHNFYMKDAYVYNSIKRVAKSRRTEIIRRMNHLPMYLRDLGDEPSWGNLHFSTYLRDKSIDYTSD